MIPIIFDILKCAVIGCVLVLIVACVLGGIAPAMMHRDRK
jgi:hypothetical protein